MEEQERNVQAYRGDYPSVKHRNVMLAIIFSIVTLGIYGIYWFVCLTNDTNKLSRFKTAGGVLAIVFTVITLGIYSFYWNYMLGKKMGDIERDTNSGVLYLILSLFGLSIINYVLAQSALNKKAY